MSSRARQPAYITQSGPSHDPNEGAFARFMRTEVWAADKRAGRTANAHIKYILLIILLQI